MRLNEDAGFALVGFAQIFAGLDGFGKTRIEVGGLRDARAVRTVPAEVGQTIGDRPFQAIHGLGEHEGKRVLAGTCRSGEDHRVWKVLTREHIAQAMNDFRIAVKVGEGHCENLSRGRDLRDSAESHYRASSPG